MPTIHIPDDVFAKYLEQYDMDPDTAKTMMQDAVFQNIRSTRRLIGGSVESQEVVAWSSEDGEKLENPERLWVAPVDNAAANPGATIEEMNATPDTIDVQREHIPELIDALETQYDRGT